MAKDTFDRQMGAIIAKMLSDLEVSEGLQDLHPFEFDKIRRRCIEACWDAFVVGTKKGTVEAEHEHIHAS